MAVPLDPTRRFAGRRRGRRTAAVLTAFLAASTPPLLEAQPLPIGPPVPTWQPNGFVNAVVIDGHTLYAGGVFDQVGPRTGTFAVIDPDDSTAVTAGAIDDTVSDVVVTDGSGGWFVATGRLYPGASESGTVLHLLADGSRDPAWPPVTFAFGAAYALAVDAGRLFMAGTFSAVNGEIRLGVAALDATTGAVLPWNAQIASDGLSYWVFHLAVAANRVVVAGSFSAVAGVPRNRVAILDATTGALLPGTLPSTLVAPVIRSVSATATRIYLEGDCQTGGNVFCGYDLDLTPLPGWTFPRSAGPVVAFASGVFATTSLIGTSTRLRVVKLDPDTGTPLAWSGPELAGGIPAANAAEPAMQVLGSTLYLGGDFTTVNGASRLRVAAVDTASGALLPWAPWVGGRVRSLAATASGVAIGGDFTSVGGVRRQNLVALDLRSGRPLANTPGVDLRVNALLKLGDVMVVAGGRPFGTSGPDVLAFSTTTGIPLNWSLSSDLQVWTLASDGRRLFVGGWFSRLGGQPRLNLGAVDLGTGALTPWNPAPDGLVDTLAVSNGTLFAAGQFNSLPGFGRPGAAAFDAATGEVLSFNPDLAAPGVVRGFAFAGDRVLLGGEPDGINRGAFRWVARGSGATVPFTSPTLPGANARRLAQAGDAIYAVANTSVGPGLASIDPVSGRVAGWANPLGVSTTAMAASADYVVITGGPGLFTPLGASLAVFDAPRASAPRRMTANVAGAAVTLGWQPGASAPAPSAYQVEAGTTLGGTDVGVFAVGPSTAVTGTLTPGTYFTRVRGLAGGRAGAASSEVIVTVPATPTPPGPPGPLSATVAAGVVTLRWGAASGNPTGYVVEAGTAPGLANLVAFATGHLDTVLTTAAPPGTYVVRVRAVNGFGPGGSSNEVTVVVP